MPDYLHPSMHELSQTISDRTAKIEELLKSKSLPPPSFAADAPSPDFIPDHETELRKLRDELRIASKTLQELVTGPKLAWINLLMLQVSHRSQWTIMPIDSNSTNQPPTDARHMDSPSHI